MNDIYVYVCMDSCMDWWAEHCPPRHRSSPFSYDDLLPVWGAWWARTSVREATRRGGRWMRGWSWELPIIQGTRTGENPSQCTYPWYLLSSLGILGDEITHNYPLIWGLFFEISCTTGGPRWAPGYIHLSPQNQQENLFPWAVLQPRIWRF